MNNIQASLNCISGKSNSYIGMPYYLGEEGWYVFGVEQTIRVDIDCSGLFYALLRDCGVTYKGKTLWRDTADGYYKMATRMSKPEIPGDCGWLPASGRKTHMVIYIGEGKTIEAGYHGPNNKYPGHGYVGTCTIAQMEARGVVWGRIPELSIYQEEFELDALQDELLKLNRVSLVARSYDESIEEARDAGNMPAVATLKKARSQAVETERKRLGLTKAQVAHEA